MVACLPMLVAGHSCICWKEVTFPVAHSFHYPEQTSAPCIIRISADMLLLKALLAVWLGWYARSSAAEGQPGPEQQPLQDIQPIEKQPNIVFIITDDQDLHMNSLAYMPRLQKHLLNEGTFFQRHYCTIALCCPSRVNLWTGKAAHNTNVTDVNPPYGKWVQIAELF